LIPTPAELQRICKTISVERGVFLEVGCFCCSQHGINKLYTTFVAWPRPVMWAFSSLAQVEEAAKTGLLRFHYGLCVRGEFRMPTLACLEMVHAFRDHGLSVEWSGHAHDTFAVRVDAAAYTEVLDLMRDEMSDLHQDHHVSDYLAPPVFAETVAPEDPLFAIALWKDPSADRWWYNVSERTAESTHEQRHEPTRSEALTAALALAEELRLEIN
jgi:hypothetical protein